MFDILTILSASATTEINLVEAVINLLAGLGALLIGFKLLSDNIEKLANGGLKKLFNKTSKNRFVGVGVGAGVTAIIQSSSASTVMIVGFVNAGLMTLFQATAMIMGANIGTTITAQIASLGAFDIGLYATLLAFVGAFMNMLCKKEKPRTIGSALGGLGLVFLALSLMSASMADFKTGGQLEAILSQVNNPFLLLLVGAAFTALIQSSSATTTILISMVAAGITIGSGGNSILYVILGTNIGTCVTALLSSIGATTNGRRASLIHLMFNTFGAIIFFVVLLVWPDFMDVTFAAWFSEPETQLAMFHTFFNVVFTLLFLPFINVFVKIAELVIPSKKEVQYETFIDDRFLSTPAVALTQATKEVARLGRISMEALNESIDAFFAADIDKTPSIREKIKLISNVNENIVAYLVKISAQNNSQGDEEFLAILHNSVNDLYRSVEIADNMTKYTRHLVEDKLVFSKLVFDQLNDFREKLNTQYAYIESILLEQQYDVIGKVDKLEDEMDIMRSKLIREHIVRLEKGECSLASSSVYINLVSNLERAGDHLHTIAHNIVDNI